MSAEQQTLRILVVDDHEIFRTGVITELSEYPDIEIVGEAQNGREAIVSARELVPDVILMDFSMPEMTGLEAVEVIKSEMPQTYVIMLTVHEENETLFQAIKGGADGYLFKNLDPAVLYEMICKARTGEVSISGQTATRILHEFRHSELPAGRTPALGENLTSREIQVLERLVKGESNQAIAQVLTVSENTVKAHLRNIMDKLRVQNRIQAAVYAVRQGLVDDES